MSVTRKTGLWAIEWTTVGLAAVIYGGWLAATYFHRLIPPLLLPLVGGWLTAWQGSLQHETIHGHPTPWKRVNGAIGFAPLSLWLPYGVYRRSHLSHHASHALTEPQADPESRYLEPRGGAAGALERAAHGATATLLGRLLLGPAVEIARFLILEAKAILAGDRERIAIWVVHLVGVLAILAWLQVCGLPLGRYLLAFVYPGAALSLLRSFAEHRADPVPARRIASVEGSPLLALLFLNNNLHAAHHRHPGADWLSLPRLHRAARPALVAADAPIYSGYGQIARRFALTPHDQILHPQLAATPGTAP